MFAMQKGIKVLHVINSLNIGGAEKLLIDSIPIYLDQGIDVDVLLLNDEKTPFLSKLEEEKRCKIIKVRGISIYNPLIIFKILPIVKRYDIIHGHLFPTLYWLSIVSYFIGKKSKFIYTEHSTSNKRRSFYIFKLIDRLFYRQYDKITTIAKDVDLALKSHLNLNSKKIVLINNGINLKNVKDARAVERNDLQLNKSLKVIIQVSSFRYPKDQMTVIKALNYLPDDFVLILVGVGDKRLECEELANNLGLLQRVKFLGSRMDVPGLLKLADYVVLSSAYEGLSLSSVEGLASGKPFLATEVPGLIEVVENAGILFPLGNYKELAKCIIELDNNSIYKADVVERCLARSKMYDINEMVKSTIELYNDVN